MLGLQSLSLIDNGNETKTIYQASLMKEWESVIGFSGTISLPTVNQLRSELKDPICLEMPSLRRNGNENKIK